MSRGRRYAKNKKNYNIFIIGIILIIFIVISIIIINNKKKNERAHIKENEDIVETISNEKSTIELEEDAEIKALVENLITEKGLDTSNFSLFYYNVDSKKSYFYNEDTYFTGASTVKMPIAMLYSVGSEVPIKFLLEQSIVNSDNTAVNILIENLGYTDCRKLIAQYSTIELDENFYSTNITNAKYAYDIVNHLYENIEDYSELLEYLKISSNGQYLKKYIKDYDVAHKYGSYNGYVHDYGIVFGETTYLIGIFTKNIASADEFIATTSLEIFNEVNANTKTQEE